MTFGFSLYYMGINIGALLGQIIGGWLGQGWGYHWGFSCAALGMTLGLVQYVLGRRHLPDRADLPDAPLPPGQGAQTARRAGAVVLALVAVGCALGLTGTLTLRVGIDLISGVSVAVPVIYFVVMFASPRTERREKSALAAYVPLFLAAAVFYVIFNQFSSVLTLFAAERTDSSLFGWHFPSSWFFAVNPGAGLLIAPLLASVWTRMGSRQPATSLKFGASLLCVGASFLLIPVAVTLTQGDRVAAPWLILVYLAQAVAELLLAPIGMAVTSRLAPRAFHGQTLAVWFCAPAMGAGLGAQLVGYYGEVSDLVYFGATGAVAILLGIVIAAATPWIRRRAAWTRLTPPADRPHPLNTESSRRNPCPAPRPCTTGSGTRRQNWDRGCGTSRRNCTGIRSWPSRSTGPPPCSARNSTARASSSSGAWPAWRRRSRLVPGTATGPVSRSCWSTTRCRTSATRAATT